MGETTQETSTVALSCFAGAAYVNSLTLPLRLALLSTKHNFCDAARKSRSVRVGYSGGRGTWVASGLCVGYSMKCESSALGMRA